MVFTRKNNLLLSSVAALVVLGTLVRAQDDATEIRVPSGNVEFLRVRGIGSYNYNCVNNQYEFVNATGELRPISNETVRLGAFSYFPSLNGTGAVYVVNGSSVRFQEIATGPPNGRDLPTALFYATSAIDGDLKGTTFVQRINTVSGIGAGTCNETQYVPFRANFVFYKNDGSAVIQSKISVPQGNVELLKAHGDATYTYRCQNTTWSILDIKGDLLQFGNASLKIGTYSVTNSTSVFEIDNSRVFFATNETADTRVPGIIPDVLFSATNTTAGKLQNVTFGQQLNSLGGNVPATPCNRPLNDVEIPFSADYYFYVQG